VKRTFYFILLGIIILTGAILFTQYKAKRAEAQQCFPVNPYGPFCVYLKFGTTCPSWAPIAYNLDLSVRLGIMDYINDRRVGGAGHTQMGPSIPRVWKR